MKEAMKLIRNPLAQIVKQASRHGLIPLYFANKAAVFQSPETKEIVKFVYKDRAYIAFLQIVKKRKDKHLPRLIAFRKLTKEPYKNFYVVKMEKLLPLTQEETSNTISAFSFLKTMDFNGPNDPIFIKYKAKVDKLEPSLVKTLEYLYTHRPSYAHWDLTFGNAMKRDDGTIVIIDPYFEY